MNLSRKTEIVGSYLASAYQKIFDDYKGEIKFDAESYFDSGRIVIRVKEDDSE